MPSDRDPTYQIQKDEIRWKEAPARTRSTRGSCISRLVGRFVGQGSSPLPDDPHLHFKTDENLRCPLYGSGDTTYYTQTQTHGHAYEID